MRLCRPLWPLSQLLCILTHQRAGTPCSIYVHSRLQACWPPFASPSSLQPWAALDHGKGLYFVAVHAPSRPLGRAEPLNVSCSAAQGVPRGRLSRPQAKLSFLLLVWAHQVRPVDTLTHQPRPVDTLTHRPRPVDTLTHQPTPRTQTEQPALILAISVHAAGQTAGQAVLDLRFLRHESNPSPLCLARCGGQVF